jgi:3-hydroxyacyl-[acyl-carrier protein] dehydratase/trans-2-decenoyl-[acyl-carrier protein] isomerase
MPVGEMMMVDRITKISRTGGEYGRGEIIAELDINPELWFFKCHFLGDPVMPGCLGLDAFWQLTGFYLAWLGHKGQGRALGADNVRFSGEVSPKSKVVKYHLHIQRVVEASLVVGYADAKLLVDDKLIYTARRIRAGVLNETGQHE